MNAAPPVAKTTPRRSSGRRVVLVIATLVSLPFAIATLLWQFGWQPGRAINHGELLATTGLPLRQLHESELLRRQFPGVSRLHLPGLQKIPTNATSPAAGPAVSPVLGHWLLALAVPAECTLACVEQLRLARQIQISLNRDMTRLQRALLGPRLNDEATLVAVQSRWPDLLIARTSEAGWQTLGGAVIDAPRLLLIDPAGRLVLRYPPTPDPKGLRRDVERLLKYSWLG